MNNQPTLDQNPPVNKKEPCFTFYTKDGFKIALNGEDPKAAWAQMYPYALSPAFTEKGYTDSHYYSNGFWLKREPVKMTIAEYIGLDSNIERQKLYNTSHNLTVELKNGDLMVIAEESTMGYFQVHGLVISVFYCERYEGSYGSDEAPKPGEHHFMVCNTSYYAPSDPDFAMRAFQARLFAAYEQKDLADVYKTSTQLQSIVEAQVLY